MTMGLAFWIVYLLALFLNVFFIDYPTGQPYPVRRLPGVLVFYVLIGLLGYKVFGSG